jgi:hypothetical protein
MKQAAGLNNQPFKPIELNKPMQPATMAFYLNPEPLNLEPFNEVTDTCLAVNYRKINKITISARE